MSILTDVRNLLLPRWKHSKWFVRRDYIETTSSQWILRRAARTDPEQAVRCAAIDRIDDISFLETLEYDPNEYVRNYVRSKLWRLKPRPSDPPQRKSFVGKCKLCRQPAILDEGGSSYCLSCQQTLRQD